MADQIDKYLEGAIERAALTPTERAKAEMVERAIDETRAFVESRPAPDLTGDVLGRIHQLGLRPEKPGLRAVLERVRDSLWTTRHVSFRFRPAYAALAAVALAAAILFVPERLRSPAGTAPSAMAGEPQLFVQFRLQAAGASDVRLAGSFTNWQPHYELHETAPGIWTITLPLAPGVHDYLFVVDGQHWVPDPYAQHVDDGFGGTNSRIAILAAPAPESGPQS